MRTPLYHGAAWYPELWDECTIREDLHLMGQLGMNVVRIGEFAWSTIEPVEGRLSLDWLEKLLEQAYQRGIQTVLGTPTAAPPEWLLRRHPEMGYQDPDGYIHGHGGRQHACYNNPTFREHSRRITAVLAQAFGRHPAVAAWQLDNEVRGHQKLCVCGACRSAWTEWLRCRYGTIDALNQEWGTGVWSNWYSSFQAVAQPSRTTTWSHHFSLLINYRRFMSDSAIGFLREQAGALHAHSTAPITHNSEDSVDEWPLAEGLDFTSADIYPEYLSLSSARMRLDSLRALKLGQSFWTMETASNVVREGMHTRPGWLACFAFLHFASGAGGFLYWPWRQMRTGTEIEHRALLYSSGVPTPGFAEVKRVAAQLETLQPILREYSPQPAQAALVRSEANGHYFFTDKVGGLEPNFSYAAKMEAEYETLLQLGVWRDVPFDSAPLEGYKVIFSPYLPYTSPEFLEKMRDHLERGGVWVVGPYCGYRERDHTVPLNAIFGKVESMLGFRTCYFEPGGGVAVNFPDGSSGRTSTYISVFEPQPEDEILGVYGPSIFSGRAWGVSRKVGNGRVYVLGSEIDSVARSALYARILDCEGLVRHPLPAEVWMCPQLSRSGQEAWALANWDERPRTISLRGPGSDLLTGAPVASQVTMPPCSVAFIQYA